MIVRYRDGTLRWMFGGIHRVKMGQNAHCVSAYRGVPCS